VSDTGSPVGDVASSKRGGRCVRACVCVCVVVVVVPAHEACSGALSTVRGREGRAAVGA
jgi:hypothetical protein